MGKSRKNFAKQRNIPSKKSTWAYYMQAIEPRSEPISRAFPGHHPQWIMQSQKLTPGRENFIMLRRYVLGASVDQVAAYLRVDRSTVSRWESGTSTLPFMAFETLRLVSENAHARLSHQDWDGWFINGDGQLVSPDRGRLSVGPEELNAIPHRLAELASLKRENRQLRSDLEESLGENSTLRKLYVSSGIVDELASIQEAIAAQSTRVNELMSRISTAKIIPFPGKTAEPQKKEAAK